MFTDIRRLVRPIRETTTFCRLSDFRVMSHSDASVLCRLSFPYSPSSSVSSSSSPSSSSSSSSSYIVVSTTVFTTITVVLFNLLLLLRIIVIVVLILILIIITIVIICIRMYIPCQEDARSHIKTRLWTFQAS